MGLREQSSEAEIASSGNTLPIYIQYVLLKLKEQTHDRLFSEKTLANFDGSDPKLPVYLAVCLFRAITSREGLMSKKILQ